MSGRWAKISGGRVHEIQVDAKHPGPGWHQVPDGVEKGHTVTHDTKGGMTFTKAAPQTHVTQEPPVLTLADLAGQIALIAQDIARINHTLNIRSKRKK